jgi:putative oxidoreductase
MTPVRSAARAMLAAIFVSEGFTSLRSPERHAVKAKPVTDRISSLHPRIPSDPATLVRVNGAAQVLGGVLLATGRATTPASLVLAASLVPTTLAGHAFWQLEDPAERRQQRINFLKNAGLFGGLLFAALDNEGRPSLRWRTAHGASHLRRRAALEAHHASGAARRAVRKARSLSPLS